MFEHELCLLESIPKLAASRNTTLRSATVDGGRRGPVEAGEGGRRSPEAGEGWRRLAKVGGGQQRPADAGGGRPRVLAVDVPPIQPLHVLGGPIAHDRHLAPSARTALTTGAWYTRPIDTLTHPTARIRANHGQLRTKSPTFGRSCANIDHHPDKLGPSRPNVTNLGPNAAEFAFAESEPKLAKPKLNVAQIWPDSLNVVQIWSGSDLSMNGTESA